MERIEKILESGFLVQGRYVSQFEQAVADYLGIKHAVAVSSGTAALHLALAALGIGPGDEVVVPAYTFPATANVVETVGAKPVFVDVDLHTYNVDVEKIEKVISARTKAIIPVHLFGNPAEMDVIQKIGKTHGLAVIEDAAGALGSTYRGKKCGTLGTMGCFSFHPRKIITTGEGGMVITDDDDLAERVRSLRNHGIQTIRDQYDFTEAGLNYRMNELGAALGANQMPEIQRMIYERQQLATLYVDLLKDLPGIAFQQIPVHSTTVWQAFVVRLAGRPAHPIVVSLQNAGIEANIGTYALPGVWFYREKYGYKTGDFLGAERLFIETIALPFHNSMTPELVKQVSQSLKEVVLTSNLRGT
jgi:dTDP-4-amino-4,6-dideoxygalactose transaminase